MIQYKLRVVAQAKSNSFVRNFTLTTKKEAMNCIENLIEQYSKNKENVRVLYGMSTTVLTCTNINGVKEKYEFKVKVAGDGTFDKEGNECSKDIKSFGRFYV